MRNTLAWQAAVCGYVSRSAESDAFVDDSGECKDRSPKASCPVTAQAVVFSGGAPENCYLTYSHARQLPSLNSDGQHSAKYNDS